MSCRVGPGTRVGAESKTVGSSFCDLRFSEAPEAGGWQGGSGEQKSDGAAMTALFAAINAANFHLAELAAAELYDHEVEAEVLKEVGVAQPKTRRRR